MRLSARTTTSTNGSRVAQKSCDNQVIRLGLQLSDTNNFEWDAFISHASEDKISFVEPLVAELQKYGLKVWFDRFTLRVGSSLRESIDEGLARSHFGVVVLSHAFFAKNWPKKELNGLFSRQVDGHNVILPVWHGVTKGRHPGLLSPAFRPLCR